MNFSEEHLDWLRSKAEDGAIASEDYTEEFFALLDHIRELRVTARDMADKLRDRLEEIPPTEETKLLRQGLADEIGRLEALLDD